MENALSSLLTRETLTHAISGAIAGVTSLSVFYPLETVRSRKQVDSDSVRLKEPRSRFFLYGLIRSLARIYANEGLGGFYKGYSSVAITLFLGNFLYFYTYIYLQTVFQTPYPKDSFHPRVGGRNSGADLAIAFVAGCLNVFVTTPLWVANTRLKLQGVDGPVDDLKGRKDPNSKKPSEPTRTPLLRMRKYSGLVDALKTICREEGVSALYSGTLPSLLLVWNPALQWTIYELLKLHCQRWTGNEQLSGVIYFVVSAIAKFCSTVMTYPLQVVQTRMRFRSFSSSSSLTQMLTSILKEDGVRGLYKGLESKIVQTVLTTAFMIVVYEKTVAFALKGLLARS